MSTAPLYPPPMITDSEQAEACEYLRDRLIAEADSPNEVLELMEIFGRQLP